MSPRSFLIALKDAIQETQRDRAVHPWPLHYEAIKSGVQSASRTRVDEIKEDVTWIDTALAPLEGLSVPCHTNDVDGRWEVAQTIQLLESLKAEDQPQRIKDGAQGLRDELASLGILESLRSDRVNMADVYRVAFRLGRRGGVKPLR